VASLHPSSDHHHPCIVLALTCKATAKTKAPGMRLGLSCATSLLALDDDLLRLGLGHVPSCTMGQPAIWPCTHGDVEKNQSESEELETNPLSMAAPCLTLSPPSAARDHTGLQLYAVLGDVSGTREPYLIGMSVLDAVFDGLAQGAQPHRLAQYIAVERQGKNQRLLF
jgi:hypothetical protein